MKVRVYKNLTRNCYSVQHWVPKKGWRLLQHNEVVILEDASVKVYHPARLKGLEQHKKYVHAFVVGNLAQHTNNANLEGKVRYSTSTGQFTRDGKPFTSAPCVLLTPTGVFA